jgi:hypothetical protein
MLQKFLSLKAKQLRGAPQTATAKSFRGRRNANMLFYVAFLAYLTGESR